MNSSDCHVESRRKGSETDSRTNVVAILWRLRNPVRWSWHPEGWGKIVVSLRQTSVLGLSGDSSAEPFCEGHMVSSPIGTTLKHRLCCSPGRKRWGCLHHCWDNYASLDSLTPLKPFRSPAGGIWEVFVWNQLLPGPREEVCFLLPGHQQRETSTPLCGR